MIRFGPSGNSQIFYDDGYKSSVDAPEWCHKHGLTAYEYSFGRMFNMSHETAKLLGDNAQKNNVLVSVHAPYYINLANPSDEVFEKNIGYLLTSLSYLIDYKGMMCVFHPGSCGKETRKDLNDKIHQLLDKIKNIDSKELKNEIKNKINEIEAELNELDKEKVLEIARDKADKVKNKTDELVELAKQAGSKAANKTASELREKAIDVTKKVLNKLENK